MDSTALLNEIKNQRGLSDRVANVILDALKDIYYPDLSLEQIQFGEIGSYGRGTNNDPVPDIDVMYLGIPNDTQKGYFDWIGVGTYELVQRWEGITNLSELRKYDIKLAQAVQETMNQIGHQFDCEGRVAFNFIRSWDVFPGVVFNIAAPIQGYGNLEFDVNLYHENEYFGIEHTKRFIPYLEQTREELGNEIAAQMILDIRQVKQAAKDYARDSETGQINKAKKVWSFIIEALITYSYPPQTREKVSNVIGDFEISSFPSVRADSDYNFPIQIIGENLTLKDVLNAGWETGLLHPRNWETLVEALRPNR